MKRSRLLKRRRLFYVVCILPTCRALPRQRRLEAKESQTKRKQLFIKRNVFHLDQVQLSDGILSACRDTFIIPKHAEYKCLVCAYLSNE